MVAHGGKGDRGRLVLTRKFGESVEIFAGGERITVTLAATARGGFKLMLEAARHVRIVRSELPDWREADAPLAQEGA